MIQAADRCAIAEVALANVEREYPHHEAWFQTGPGDGPRAPREAHPAFYGSFDWHSCVEMHWVLVRLLTAGAPGLPRERMRAVLAAHLTRAALAAEAAFFARDEERGNERPYGWGWLLRLHHDLATWHDPDAAVWAANMRPLAELFVARLVEWLPRATYPVRHGAHANSAFALSLALPEADRLARAGRPELREAIRAAALRWFGGDRDAPAAWEPSGADFLSPVLTEAELMTRVLEPAAFQEWLGAFLPGLAAAGPPALFAPAVVSDPTDGQIAHLHGLNLSRAWCMRRLAGALPTGDPRADVLTAAADRHATAALPHVAGSDYMVEHWLAAYAVLLETETPSL
jgi:Protein of unknown function (DUF2891)